MEKTTSIKVAVELRDALKAEAKKSGMTIIGLLRIMLQERVKNA